MFAAHGSKFAAAAGGLVYINLLVGASRRKPEAASSPAASSVASAATAEADQLRAILSSKEAELQSAKAAAALQISEGEVLVAKGLAMIADGRAALN